MHTAKCFLEVDEVNVHSGLPLSVLFDDLQSEGLVTAPSASSKTSLFLL